MTVIERLQVELPLFQAPMAGVSTPAMAAAVSNAGALGAIAVGATDAAGARKVIASVRELTKRSFVVNVFCHRSPARAATREAAWIEALRPTFATYGAEPPKALSESYRSFVDDDAMLALFLETKPPVVSFHFGLPEPALVARVKALGAKILASATTVAEARWLEAQGVDAIIAQGAEAGGHRGIFLSADLTTQVGTFALVPQIVQAVQVPVIAAGAIADAQGVAAAMALGATGVQVGTAYLLCPEATTSAIHRAALKSEAAEHTALTNLFTGRPARGIVNRIMRELGPISSVPPAFPLATAAIAPLRAQAESRGLGDFSPLWAGQNVRGCKEIPAAQLTQELAAGVSRHSQA